MSPEDVGLNTEGRERGQTTGEADREKQAVGFGNAMVRDQEHEPAEETTPGQIDQQRSPGPVRAQPMRDESSREPASNSPHGGPARHTGNLFQRDHAPCLDCQDWYPCHFYCRTSSASLLGMQHVLEVQPPRAIAAVSEHSVPLLYHLGQVGLYHKPLPLGHSLEPQHDFPISDRDFVSSQRRSLWRRLRYAVLRVYRSTKAR